MAIRTYLQGLGATHLFDLDNNGTLTTDDLGSSSTPTNISGGNYTFDTDPVCEGVTYSLDVVANTSPNTNGAVFTNVSGINTGITGYSTDKRSLLIWCKQSDIQNPTCIYEQGGGANNFAFMGGALTTFQAADSGQPFLIVQSLSLAQPERPYCLVGVWEYHTQHAGSGNRVLFYINGVLQGISELTGTDPFPNHVGNIECGNSGDNLQSFAGTVFTSQTTEKNCNFLGMFNNVSLTQAQCREIFERATIADVLIPADTVANQQAALDALSGNTYQDMNCAIRIIQATDATNYRLFVDNINFVADDNIEDISVQFVGTGVLTLENTNGTVIKYTSAPPEVETTSTTYTGGGSIVVVNNTKRVTTDQTITNPQDDKIVFDGSGSNYTIDGGIVPVIENVSGNTVTVNLINGAPTPTLLETDGSFIVVDAGIINVADGTTYTVDAEKKFVVDTDTVTSFTISGIIPKEIETTGTGSTTIIGINNAKLTTTTISGTGTLVLGDGLNPSSNWVVGSGTLTLNGTEGDLSGLRGLADVDYADAGGKIVYTVNDTTKIIISGTGDLTIDSDVEQLVCGVTPASGVHTIDVKNSGRLQVGKAKNVGGFTIYSSGPAIVFTNDSANNLFTVADSWANLFIDNGGTMDWYGGEIQTIGCFNAEPSSIFNTYSNEAIFVSVSSSLQATRPEAYVRMKSSNINVNGFVNKFGIYLSIGQPTTFKGYEPISSGSAIDMSNQSASNVFYDFEDLIAGKGNTRDIGGKSETWLRLLNTNLGSDITVTAQQTNAVSDQQYIVENKKGIIFNYEDEVGNIIQGAKIYLSDTDHGNRLGANQVGTNASYLNDNVYTGSSNASGNIDFSSVANSILLSVYHHNNENGNPIYSLYDSRGNNNDVSDLFTFYSISYLQTPANVTLELKGIGTLNQSQVLVTDLLITETTKATVDAYTELETPQKFYDRAKSYLYDNFQGEANTIVSREGNLIDCGSYDLVVDATSGTAFSIAGNVITIKASTFTGDITTTGTITLQNGASFIGTFTDTNGTTTVTELTLTGLQSNSEVRIYQAGTTTEIDGVENSGTTFSTTIIESSVDVVVFNVGYIPVRLLAVDTSSNVTLPIQQRLDRNYNNP